MKKVLGIDYGERRIGIAISDSLKIIATPLTVIDRKKQNYLETIQQIIIENGSLNLLILVKIQCLIDGKIMKSEQRRMYMLPSPKLPAKTICTTMLNNAEQC